MSSKGIKKMDRLIHNIEMTLVNGRRVTKLHKNFYKNDDGKYLVFNVFILFILLEIFKYSVNKEIRLNYFDKCMRFYNDLKSMCEKLRNFPKDINKQNPNEVTRDQELKNYLTRFNKRLRQLRAERENSGINEAKK